jgi:hypothetical protein
MEMLNDVKLNPKSPVYTLAKGEILVEGDEIAVAVCMERKD